MARPPERQSDWKPEAIRNRKPVHLWKKLVGKVSLRLSYFHTPSERLFLKHVSIRGVELVVPANEDVGRLIAYLGNYEPDETDFLIPSIRPDDVCFDVGANIGCYTTLMARAASSGGVHAFEPDPFCGALLQLNLRLNRLENVTLNPVVIGASRGRVQFVRATDSGFNSLRNTGRRAVASTFPVAMDTLDAYLDATGAPRVDVLKIDVEGAESLVLEGARRLLSDPLRRPRLILLGLFEPNQRPFGSNVTDIVNRLGRSGYTPFVVSEGKPMPYDGGCASRFSNVFFYVGSTTYPAAAEPGQRNNS
ncbi:MAG TPA: FkbM family methyltransferase [Candidatus Acidoferrales bacterium]|nr:FkbM family methyltransferase [Candidatus Acidoferrales bacterium]